MIHYLRRLAAINRLPEAAILEWLFYPGMLFASRRKWWGDFACRHSDHEGLDIWLYRTGNKHVGMLDPGTQVLPIAAGRVINICTDFLGVSVIVENEQLSGRHARVVSVYSHLDKNVWVSSGQRVSPEKGFATLASTAGRKSGIPCHLHISVMEISREIPPDRINWSVMGNPEPDLVKMYNPFHWKSTGIDPAQ